MAEQPTSSNQLLQHQPAREIEDEIKPPLVSLQGIMLPSPLFNYSTGLTELFSKSKHLDVLASVKLKTSKF